MGFDATCKARGKKKTYFLGRVMRKEGGSEHDRREEGK